MQRQVRERAFSGLLSNKVALAIDNINLQFLYLKRLITAVLQDEKETYCFIVSILNRLLVPDITNIEVENGDNPQ